MEVEKVKEKIEKAYSLFQNINTLNSTTVNDFTNGCNKVSVDYVKLADIYEQETQQWSNIVISLLDCLKKTIPIDDKMFSSLLEEINNLQNLALKEETKGNVNKALEQLKNLSNTIKHVQNNQKQLTNNATKLCEAKTETTRVQHNRLPTDDTDRIAKELARKRFLENTLKSKKSKFT